MPLSHPSHLFSPYSKTRVSRTFPPITNQFSLTPEHSPSPPYITLNCTFSVFFDKGVNHISNAMARNAGIMMVQSASCQSSSHSPLNSERDNDCPEPDNSNFEPSLDLKGEVGHPRGNGYSLSNELKWDKTVYEAVQKGVHRLADAHLNNDFGISKQDDRDVWIVLKKANQEFPILHKNMVNVLKQQQLDRDGLYLLIYFLALANHNNTIPPSHPLGIHNLMLEEHDEILARATVNSRLFTSPASEHHQENTTSPIILTPTGVGRLPPQRDSNSFRDQLKGISPSVLRPDMEYTW
ncbi:hypothetical protein M422DRAFT_265622 [Sphaerobolus stellatus SS14]|uniref:Uncharacterized protein n=1 Tax=Sphaerobolus stellatus (strain SS14) TaxID=990650 RepID=A0A0C9V593_SPHS4|nr:hypothetical protein M422DRAFT_265622 [Sphaerobolus stellatus SS14]